MGAGTRLRRFGSGGLLGAGLGGVTAMLLAPDSGDGLRRRLRDRFRRARLAGVEAQAARSEELIHKFRRSVNDPAALADTESSIRTRVQVARAELAEPATPTPELPTG